MRIKDADYKQLALEKSKLAAELRLTNAKLNAAEQTIEFYKSLLDEERAKNVSAMGQIDALNEENEQLEKELDTSFSRRDYWRAEAIDAVAREMRAKVSAQHYKRRAEQAVSKIQLY
nr:MAG TPA: hypothetical protein [Bacteriophage sp.]